MKGQQENTHQTYMSKHCMNVIRMFSFENNTVPLSCVVVKKGEGGGELTFGPDNRAVIV